MRTLALVAVAALALAGCGSKDEEKKAGDTGIAVWDDGKPAAAETGEKGKFAMSLPGFDLKMDLPQSMLDKSDFEIDGVKLYPGSTITAMAIAKPKSGGEANVDIGFVSPADPAAVRAYFVKEFGDRLEPSTAGGALSGETSDGDIFTIKLAPAAGGGSTGTLRING